MPTATAAPSRLPTPTPFLIVQSTPDADAFPTLADLWDGRAHFIVDVPVTDLPMGESDTIRLGNGEFWSYLHASERSAGVIDQCGAPVAFPGCTVIYRSDDGLQFAASRPADLPDRLHPVSVYARDRPRQPTAVSPRLFRRRAPVDGLRIPGPSHAPSLAGWAHLVSTGAGGRVHGLAPLVRDCPAEERIGEHPFVPFDYECLRGGPPGLVTAGDTLYVFMAQGQNPGAMGCFRRPLVAVKVRTVRAVCSESAVYRCRRVWPDRCHWRRGQWLF